MSDDGIEIDDEASLRYVHESKLRALIKEWRENKLPRNGSFREAADELEELINDE